MALLKHTCRYVGRHSYFVGIWGCLQPQCMVHMANLQVWLFEVKIVFSPELPRMYYAWGAVPITNGYNYSNLQTSPHRACSCRLNTRRQKQNVGEKQPKLVEINLYFQAWPFSSV